MGRSWPLVMGSIACVFAGFAQAAALPTRNMDFSAWNAAGLPEGWSARSVEGFQVAKDCAVTPKPGACAVRITGANGASAFQPVAQGVAAAGASGHAAVLSGYIRTRGVTVGAALWLRADGPGGKMFHIDNMGAGAPKGDTEWTRVEVRVPVPANTRALIFGTFLSGAGTAWFANLELTVDERVRTAAIEIPVPAVPQRIPADAHLLDDSELALAADALPAVTSAWRDDVRARAHPIRSLVSEDFSDLEFLVPLLEGKRIVQLGESAHGIGEFDRVKARLVKFLHRRLGFDVLAFESSLAECHLADGGVGVDAPVDTMRHCIFGVWHAEETVPVFEELAAQRKGARPLTLAGFDTQNSSGNSVEVSKRLLAAAGGDADLASAVEKANAALKYGIDSAQAQAFVATYEALATKIEARRATPGRGIDEDAWLARAAWSRARFAEQLSFPTAAPEGGAARDRGMADNLDFLLDRAYPGRKVIVWAHNYHVSRVAEGRIRPMGSWVAQRRGAETYTIALFMGRGVGAQNDRTPYEIKSPLDNSLEAIMANAGWLMSFVDLGSARPASWRAEEIKARSWGLELDTLVPAKTYDAVLYIDRVGPPAYLPWPLQKKEAGGSQ